MNLSQEPSTEILKKGKFSIYQNCIVAFPIPLLKKLQANFSGIELQKAHLCIFHVLLTNQFTNSSILDFIGVTSKTKLRILTSRHYKIWEKLVNLKMLEVRMNSNGTFYSTAKKKCKYYRIKPELFKDEAVRVQGHYHYQEKVNELECNCALLNHTRKSLDRISIISPNQKEFSEILRKTTEDLIVKANIKLEKLNKQKLIDPSLKEAIALLDAHNLYRNVLNKLKCFDYKHFRVSRAATNSRISHVLTSFPKTAFPLLRMDGEYIVEFDLSNSQPLILASVLKNILFDQDRTSLLYDPCLDFFYSNILLQSTTGDNHSHEATILFSHSEIEDLKNEVSCFHEWCGNGKFYENLNHSLLMKGQKMTRKEMKKGFIKVLFGKYCHDSKLKRQIKTVFPKIIKFVDSFKYEMFNIFKIMVKGEEMITELAKYMYSKTKGNKNPFNSGNDYLPIRLQIIEASIFVDTILKRLVLDGIYSFTRHDSVCCKYSDRKLVQKILIEELSMIFGEKGFQLKSEVWK